MSVNSSFEKRIFDIRDATSAVDCSGECVGFLTVNFFLRVKYNLEGSFGPEECTTHGRCQMFTPCGRLHLCSEETVCRIYICKSWFWNVSWLAKVPVFAQRYLFSFNNWRQTSFWWCTRYHVFFTTEVSSSIFSYHFAIIFVRSHSTQLTCTLETCC